MWKVKIAKCKTANSESHPYTYMSHGPPLLKTYNPSFSANWYNWRWRVFVVDWNCYENHFYKKLQISKKAKLSVNFLKVQYYELVWIILFFKSNWKWNTADELNSGIFRINCYSEKYLKVRFWWWIFWNENSQIHVHNLLKFWIQNKEHFCLNFYFLNLNQKSWL